MYAGIMSIIVRSRLRSCASAVARSWRADTSASRRAPMRMMAVSSPAFFSGLSATSRSRYDASLTAHQGATEERGGLVRRGSRPHGGRLPARAARLREAARTPARKTRKQKPAWPRTGHAGVRHLSGAGLLLPRSLGVGGRGRGLVLRHGRVRRGRRIRLAARILLWHRLRLLRHRRRVVALLHRHLELGAGQVAVA